MPSINLRQLRETRQLKAWLREGKTVELRERERVLARIVPAGNVGEPKQLPDFEARTEKAFGDRIFPNLVIEERKRARY
jgi:hypothetical protein